MYSNLICHVMMSTLDFELFNHRFPDLIQSYYWPQPVRPNWSIYWTLGNFLKPLATIDSPKSPILSGIFVKVSLSIIFLVKSFQATFIDILRFFSGHTVAKGRPLPTTAHEYILCCFYSILFYCFHSLLLHFIENLLSMLLIRLGLSSRKNHNQVLRYKSRKFN